MLKSITVKDIKGINCKKLCLNLHPNKPSMLVAPNGFGKSSLAIAFASMNKNRIVLEDKNCHKTKGNKDARVEIIINDNKYIATSDSNSILKKNDVFVINSSIYAKSNNRNTGSFTIKQATLDISPVVLIDTIPKNTVFEYSLQTYRHNFGQNGKIFDSIKGLLPNSDLLDNIDFSTFKKKGFINSINKIKETINNRSGTTQEIKAQILENQISELNKISELRDLAQRIDPNETIDSYLQAMQLADFAHTENFKDALKYNLYKKERKEFDNLLKSFNTSNETIKTKEEKYANNKKRLIVHFPSATSISNGERDILTFISQLKRANRKFRKQDCILVIDEIFDYLDDANLVAFQYYIIKMIEEFKQQKRKLYPLLLTHLDPSYFKSYRFNTHQIQVRYLANESTRGKVKNHNFIKLVRNRDQLQGIDSIWFHFNPNNINKTAEFASKQLNEKWGCSATFYNILYKEVDKYIKNEAYDPIAVLLGTRIKIEKLAYNKLPGVDQKTIMLERHTTVSKLDYCSDQGIEIPDTWYLLGILHNEALHWNDGQDKTLSIASKLDNFVIRKLITELFQESE